MADKALTPELLEGILAEARPKDGSVDLLKLSDPRTLCTVKGWISTGCLPIDIITGGGFPIGRITEIFGDHSTGKSLLAAQAVVTAQQAGYLAVFIDAESAIDKCLMESIGVDLSMLAYYAPDSVEEMRKILTSLIDAKDAKMGLDFPMIVVWDSVAATSTQAEMEIIAKEGLDKKQYPAGAQQIGAFLRSGFPRRCSKSRICAVFINQLRDKIGVMFGEDESTYGGRALSFYSSLRIKLDTSGAIKGSGTGTQAVVGHRVKIQTKKNRMQPPFQVAEAPVYFGFGFDEADGSLEMAMALGLVQKPKSSTWYTMEVPDKDPIKFQKAQWCEPNGIFDQNYDYIAKRLWELHDASKRIK